MQICWVDAEFSLAACVVFTEHLKTNAFDSLSIFCNIPVFPVLNEEMDVNNTVYTLQSLFKIYIYTEGK